MDLTNLTIWVCPGCSSQIVNVRSAYGLFCGCAYPHHIYLMRRMEDCTLVNCGDFDVRVMPVWG